MPPGPPGSRHARPQLTAVRDARRAELLPPSRPGHQACRLRSRPAPPSALLGRLFTPATPVPPCSEPALEAWLRETCVKASPPLVLNCTVADDAAAGGGRGLVATTRLAPGAAAASLPAAALLSADAAVSTSKAGAAAASGPDGSPYAALIAALAEGRASPASRWAPYAAALPSTTGCVLEWTDDQVAWLQGSPLAGVAAVTRAEAAAACGGAAVPALVDAAGMGEGAARHAAAWAASMLLTRLIRAGSLGEVLAPWLDMANHAPGGGGSGLPGPAPIEWSSGGGGALTLRVTQATPAGAPVHATYGPDRPAGELLLAYGFLPPPGPATPGGGLPVGPGADDPESAPKLAALAARGAPPPGSLTPLRPGRLPAGLVERAAFCAARDADVDALASLLLDGAGGRPPPSLLALGARAAADTATALLAAKKAAPSPPGDDPLGAMVADALARERRALEGVAAELSAVARGWERASK